MIVAILIMLTITAVFVNRVIHYTNKLAHDCNKHELYYEDDISRGTFCSICNRNISIEYYSEKKG